MKMCIIYIYTEKDKQIDRQRQAKGRERQTMREMPCMYGATDVYVQCFQLSPKRKLKHPDL